MRELWQKEITPKEKNMFISISLIIIVVGLFVYGNSLNGQFIWDDHILVKNNPYITSWTYLPKIFTENIGRDSGRNCQHYRPLQTVTYMLDYSLWGLNVQGYHITNTLLHIFVGLSLYWLITLLYGNWLLSLLTSLFFIVHPIHTAAISYISGRADALAGLFILLCLIFYIKYLQTKKATLYIAIILSYTFALLSRENSLIFIGLLLLYHYTFEKKYRPKIFLSFIGVSFLYVLLRLAALNVFLPNPSPATTLWQRLPGFFVAITNYLRLLLLPLNLHMEYGKRLFAFTHPKTAIGIIMVIFLLFYAFKKSRTKKLAFFSILWFFITLLPQSNLCPLNAYMAEHWLYLPSIGFFLILAGALNYLYKKQKGRILAIILTLSLLSFYSYLTIRQNNYWKDPVTFYQRTLPYTSRPAKIYSNLGTVYSDIGKNEEAIASLKKAIAINPRRASPYYNLGNVYSRMKKLNKAVAAYKKAIEIKPDYAKAHNNLAIAYSRKKEYALAIKHCDRAIELGYKVHEEFSSLLEPYRNHKQTEIPKEQP